MSEKIKYEQLCTGCGLCKSCKINDVKYDTKGFLKPKINDNKLSFYSNYCFFSENVQKLDSSSNIWGEFLEIYLGYSNDKNIRKNASSGGIVTSICIYLLENKIVDGIIQTKEDDLNPLKNITIVSKRKEDVIKCMGSRYSISSPLINILEMLDKDKKYAFVGKPCDIKILKNYCNKNKINNILFYLSFFCAGIPSDEANIRLLNNLDINMENVKTINYRGNGWPGYYTASDDKKTGRISYSESWGEVLGRDIMYVCRFCSDGIGESADISCGDAWYQKNDGSPDFSEHEGRNVVFARSLKGKKLLLEMKQKKVISLSNFENYDTILKKIQLYQFTRRATLYPIFFSMKIFNKPTLNYNKKSIKNYSKNISIDVKIKRVLGTIKRIINKRI